MLGVGGMPVNHDRWRSKQARPQLAGGWAPGVRQEDGSGPLAAASARMDANVSVHNPVDLEPIPQ